MVNAQRALPSVLIAAALVVALAACSPAASSGGNTTSGSGSGGTKTTSASVTFSGSESGTAVINLCTGSDASIYVTVDGSSDKLPGVVSATNMDFDGTDSIYTLDKTGPSPQVSSDGNTFTVDGVILKSVIDPTKKLTFTGKVTCP